MFELNQLKETNPAIIYCFEPEASPKALSGSRAWEDTLIPITQQYTDYLDSYVYIEQHVLPELNKNGTFTATQLIDWIKNIHKIMANSLMKNLGHVSGEYIGPTNFVMRWHQGCTLGTEFSTFISGQHKFSQEKDFIKYLAENKQVKPDEAKRFIALLNKALNNQNIKITEHQWQGITKNPRAYHRGLIALNKLNTAYLDNHFTKEEKADVDKIVKICMWPSEVPNAMNQYAKKMVELFNNCPRDDLDKISKFLSTVFYEFTEIHPFGNGNGRVGLTLINLFLMHYKLPTIMLRHPGDDDNPNSEYSKAIAQINTTREPLEHLIKKRIIEEQSKSYSDENLFKIITLRVGLGEVCKEILKIDPLFNFESFNQNIKVTTLLMMQKVDEKTANIFLLADIYQQACTKLEALKTSKPLLSQSMFAKQQVINNRELIINGLTQITAVNGWKATDKNGLIGWRECANEKEASMITQNLQQLDIAKISKAVRSDNKSIYVVKCEFKDLDALKSQLQSMEKNSPKTLK